MKKYLFILTFISLLSSQFAFSLTSEERDANITSELCDVTELIMDLNSENTSMLFTQPDAYIGKIFPSLPPHFSAGISVTGTFFNTDDLIDPMNNIISIMQKELLESFGNDAKLKLNFDIPAKIPMPTAAASIRLGVFFLPFDIGFYGMYVIPGTLDSFKYDDFSAGIDYKSFWIDLRYSLLDGQGILPVVSVGIGYSYLNEDISFKAEKGFSYKIVDSQFKGKFNSEIEMDLTQHSLFAQLQLSKKILLLTPYAGFRYTIVKNDADIKWEYKANKTQTTDTSTIDFSRKVSKNSSSDFDLFDGKPQLYGGIGINFPFFQLGLNIQWNFKSNYFSGGISALLKI